MAIMLAKTYAAFKAAGVSEVEATAAAEEIAGYENRLAKIESDLLLLKWMVGTNVAMTVAIFVKLFIH
jgi:hypothetical protein